MNKYTKLASNTMVLAIGQFGSKFLVLFLTRFYQSVLKEEGFGEISTIIDTCTLLMAFITLSIGEAIIRFGLDKEYDRTQVFSIGMRVTTQGTISGILFVPLISLLYLIVPENNVIQLLNEFSWLIVLYIATGSFKSTCALFVRSAGYVRLYAIDGIVTTVMNIVFNIIFLIGLNLGVVGYLLSVICADICSIIFLWVMGGLKHYFQLFGLDRHLKKAMLRFSLPMIPTSVMWWIINVSDTFFVSSMMGFTDSGLYKAAYRLPNMIALLSGIFSQAWNMSAITEKNSRTIAKFYTNVFNIFQSVVYFFAGGMLLLMKPAISIICDTPFHIAYIYTPFLVLAVVFTCFSTFMGSVYLAAKKSVRSMATTAIGAVLNLILNAILIPFFGLYGASIATFASFLVIFVIRAIDSRKFVFMDVNVPKIVANVLILSSMGFVIIFVTDISTYNITLCVLFVMIVALNLRSVFAGLRVILNKKK